MPAVTLDAQVVPPNATQGQQVTFDAAASSDQPNPALTYNWTFGDGGTASGANLTDPTYTYNAPSPSGSPYTVSLTVSDGTQDTATASETIAVSDVPPSVNAGTSQTIYAGSAAPFNASVTDAGGPSQIASIQWDFNNNGTTFNADPSANGLTNPTYTYASAGTYVVAVEATDVSGQTTEDFTTVTVKPTDALIVNAGADLTGTSGQPVSLGGSYTDPGGTVSSSGIAWDTNYDGNTFTPNVTGTLTPSVTYASAGTYYAALQITDSTGASDLSVVQVTVNPISYVGPTANAGSDQSINPGTNASFSGSYTDPDGTVSSSGIAWDFNYDGVSFNPMATGTLTPTYRYDTPGSYTVALQITDSNGLTSLSTLNLTVNSVAPTVSVQGQPSVIAGQTASFNASASLPPGDLDTMSVAWDFNYDGSTFNPSAAGGQFAQHAFATPGTYTVAYQATDSEGDSSLATTTITVNATSMLVVNAGSDQFVSEGDTTSFSGAWTDGSGTVNTSTAQWDFNFTGTFVADPSANGTLTPSHQFTTPGLYVVALQLTDSNHVTSIGELDVAVSDVAPTADAGGDQTVNQGSTVSFTGTATQPPGVNGYLSYAWDFDYGDHTTFTPMSTGTLTPTYTYMTPGTYEAALRVTDGYGGVGLATATITVNDVAPTATVTNSGTANVGSPVTFTVSNLQDMTPGDTPSYAVDWDGSGTFQPLSSDDLTIQNGTVSFSHSYDTPSGPSGYNAVVQITDGNGGVTDYTSNVVVNGVAPTATFGPSAPSGNSGTIDATAPFVFGASDPSVSDTQAGFTYYVSLDGGTYTSSSSASYLLPVGISTGQHTVTGYAQDSNGQTSTPVSWTGTVQAAGVTFLNDGTGQVQIDWTGSGGAVTLNANQSETISGTAANFTVTLLTSGATYQLDTNGSIDAITAATGVSDVSLTVDTGVNYTSASMWVGDGHIGTVSLPGGGSTVSLYARGDLASLSGPSSTGAQTGLSALDLVFANLSDSITGLDSIGSLNVSGWLGTSAAQEVEAGDGIGNLTAYGIGANVYADLRQDAGDPTLTVNVGDGGVPGSIEAGNVGNVAIAGSLNVFDINNLEGNFDPLNTNLLRVRTAEDVAKLTDLGNVGTILFDGKIEEAPSITAKTIGTLFATNNLTVTGYITATTIDAMVVAGTLTVAGIKTTGALNDLNVWQDLKVTAGAGHNIDVGALDTLVVGGNLTAMIIEKNSPELSNIFVGGNFTGGVNAGTGSIGLIRVDGKFTAGGNVNLVAADDTIEAIVVSGNIGVAGLVQKIQAGTIGTIESHNGSILLSSIETTGKAVNGSIEAITAVNGTLAASVIARKGNIETVEAKEVAGNITALAGGRPNNYGSIGLVYSTDAIPDKVTITADVGIYKIQVKNGGKEEAFTVKAQTGLASTDLIAGTSDAGPLTIDVGGANYLGTVTLGRVPPGGSAVTYDPNNVLLSVVANGNKAVTWSVSGTGEGTINGTLEFAKLKTGMFGWVKKAKPFSADGLSISEKGP